MKKLFLMLVSCAMLFSAASAKPKINYVDAQTLTHLGKMCETTNPYHRVEVSRYDELNKTEKNLLITAAGEFIAFETDATEIWLQAEYGRLSFNRAMPETAGAGFNLYMEKDGEWLWASSRVNKGGHDKDGVYNRSKPLRIAENLDGTMHRCLLYLPLFAELTSLRIGVPEGYTLAPIENPFRHKIAIFGSSFTHGSGASCAGQTYPAFFSRSTGLYLCSFGMSGNSKLQRVMGEILAGTDAEAYICDAFSNPSIEQIDERIRPFLDEIRKVKPEAPVIFLRTIYREYRIFNTKAEEKEQTRIDHVNQLMKEICKEYQNVYFVDVADQTGTDHHTSADGVHPYSWGYFRWAQAIEKPVLKILKKHGIK